jgi:hypothetical protein
MAYCDGFRTMESAPFQCASRGLDLAVSATGVLFFEDSFAHRCSDSQSPHLRRSCAEPLFRLCDLLVDVFNEPIDVTLKLGTGGRAAIAADFDRSQQT